MKNKFSKPIRLYWGENYAPKPPDVAKVLRIAFKESLSLIHLYPGSLQDEVKGLLAKYCGVGKDWITLGTGIEGLLVDIFNQYLSQGEQVVILEPTFGGYVHPIEHFGGRIIKIPVNFDTKLTLEDILRHTTTKTKILCIASPNTATGAYHIEQAVWQRLLKEFKGMVIADECYFGIGTETLVPLLAHSPNLIILRSASKVWGLAGIRFGWAIAAPTIINNIEEGTIGVAPDQIATSTLLVCKAILPYANTIALGFRTFKDQFAKKLSGIKGLRVIYSKTTFIPVVLAEQISLSDFIKNMEDCGIGLKNTQSLGYLLVGVPPKEAWTFVLNCFKEVLTLL